MIELLSKNYKMFKFKFKLLFYIKKQIIFSIIFCVFLYELNKTYRARFKLNICNKMIRRRKRRRRRIIIIESSEIY